MYIFPCCLTKRIGLLYSSFLFMELWLLCSQGFHVNRLLMRLNLNQKSIFLLSNQTLESKTIILARNRNTRNKKWHLKILYHFHDTLRMSKLWNCFWNWLISFWLIHHFILRNIQIFFEYVLVLVLPNRRNCKNYFMQTIF